MDYRCAGASGLKVSAVGLGTNNFGGRTDEGQSALVIDEALEAGVTSIDTADIYNLGRSEEIIGRALRGGRHRAEILTKVYGSMVSGPHDRGSGRKHIVQACEDSLRRLQTDYIDLYQLHGWDPETPIDETMRALDDLVRAGKVRYIGCSNFTAWQLTWGLWSSDRKGYIPFATVQPHYNLFERGVVSELVPACVSFGVGIIPYFPLAGGLLTGKYTSASAVPEGTRYYGSDHWMQELTEGKLRAVAGLKQLAERHGKTVGQLAIAWLLAQPAVCTVIAGATRPEQLRENAGAAEWVLDSSVLAQVAEIVGPRS